MRIIDLEGSNCILSKPDNMSDEECAPITAVEGFDLSGNHYFLIGVQPNKEDLEALNRGEPIYIKVTGDGFAPIAIWTMNENCEPND